MWLDVSKFGGIYSDSYNRKQTGYRLDKIYMLLASTNGVIRKLLGFTHWVNVCTPFFGAHVIYFLIAALYGCKLFNACLAL